MSIEALIPKAGTVDEAGLRRTGAEALAGYVADASHPWWRRRPCVVAARAAGFRWIDGALASTRVDGLCVYYFGHRESLAVRELLFYWQD